MKAKKPNISQFEKLRQKHPTFTYDDYEFHLENRDLVITYHFTISPDISFTPTIVIQNIPPKTDLKSLDYLIFQLGLAEIPSYWKATCSPKININCGHLTQNQISFLSNLLTKGMTEFYYINQIDFTAKDLFIISSSPNHLSNDLYQKKLNATKVLIPIGGGKDSLVSLKLISQSNQYETACLGVNPPPATQETFSLKMCTQAITVKRTIDSKLIHLNKECFLNGHTPFTSVLGFISILVAGIFDYKYVAFSNEQSSNEGNVIYNHEEVNHQYSKSFDYELKFNAYVQKYLLTNCVYFSFLRPLNETKIAQIFANYPELHHHFISCNKGQTDKTWCGNCPKCLGTYLILFPHLNREQRIQIFKSDFFANSENKSILESLAGLTSAKPFECVPTFQEIKDSINQVIEKLNQENLPIPKMITNVRQRMETNSTKTISQQKKSGDLLPSNFKSIIRNELHDH